MQPSKLYSLASLLVAFLLTEALAAPLVAFDGSDLQLAERQFSNDLDTRAIEVERRGNVISKPSFKCPYCGTKYSTAEAAKECSAPSKKSGKISCKAKF
ncbi:hypothetical protein C8J56DRAFT_974971 [Mycena floridula]|nr:hypothetical protein C8J56DRAFT_974971 [Mycena floridula]